MRISCSAVLFDLDGVLVDSTGHVERQWREWAAKRGLEADRFVRVCHGRRALETIRLAAPELDAEAEVARFAEFVVEDGRSLQPLPGARELLERLPAGLWAVITSSVRASAVRRLREAWLRVPAVLIAAEDVVHGKPHPEGYLLAAERLDVPAAGCVVIEDAPAGIEAAQRAGMRTLALAGTHAAPELHAADLVIARLPAAVSRPIDEAVELLVPSLAGCS